MSNLGRYWKEEEIQAVKEALNADDTDYSGFPETIINIFKSAKSFNGGFESAFSPPATIATGIIAAVTALGALVSIPAVLTIIDTAIDIDDWYENYKERWQSDPDNTDWYTENIRRKNNIRLGDAICFGSSAGEFIERNQDGSYDFYSLLKPEFLNKHLARAINQYSPDIVIPSINNNNDEFQFYDLSYFRDFNLNRYLGRAINYNSPSSHYPVEKYDGESEQYDFKRMWKYHAVNDTDYKLYLTKELKAISSFYPNSSDNFEEAL